MRILVLTHDSAISSTGAASSVVRLTARLLAGEHDVTVLSWGSEPSRTTSINGLRTVHLFHPSLNDVGSIANQSSLGDSFNSWGNAFAAPQFLCIASRGPRTEQVERLVGAEFDVILKEGPDSSSISTDYNKWYGIPSVERLHWVGVPWCLPNSETWFQTSGESLSRAWRMTRTLSRTTNDLIQMYEAWRCHARTVVTVSPLDLASIAPKLPGRRIASVYSPVFEAPQTPQMDRAEPRRSATSLDAPRRRVAFFSSVYHNYEITLEFIDRAATSLPEVDFILMGPTSVCPHRHASPANVRRLGVLPETLFHRELERADVCIFPVIRGHGIQTKIVQSLSYGKPVITTSALAKPFPELRGIVLVEDEPQAFIDRIGAVLTDSKFLKELATKTFAVYQSTFSNSVHLRRMSTLLKEAE